MEDRRNCDESCVLVAGIKGKQNFTTWGVRILMIAALGGGMWNAVQAADVKATQNQVQTNKEEIRQLRNDLRDLAKTANETNAMVREMHAVFKLHSQEADR